MNGLPQLRTDWMPNLGNALLRAEQIKGARAQNQLAQQQLTERPGERNWLLEQRGMERQRFGREEEKAERDSVSQVMEIGKSILARVPSSKEYGSAYDFLVREFSSTIPELAQMLPKPGTFKNEEDFNNQRAALISSAEEVVKLRRGEPITMSKQSPDGTISKVTAKTPQEAQQFSQRGYQLGTITGKPQKTLERFEREAQIKAKYHKPAVKITIGQEKFDIQKMATAGEKRTELIANKTDKDFYEANVSIFNTTNKRNEVAYWDKSEKWHIRDQTKITKLTVKNIKDGWTPQNIEEFAGKNGMTIKEVLKEIKAIE